jgi:radical SAM superfamily enzyme YgiQ (UPF0313 family)
MNPRCANEIFDAQFLGEYEAFSDDVEKLFAGLPSKEEALARFAEMEGVLLHEKFGPPVRKEAKKFPADISGFKTQTEIYSPEAMFGNMHLIEVQRGCPRACKFCAAPAVYSPFRFRSADAIIKMVDEGILHRKKIGLIGSDILSHPEFVDIASAIHSRGATFSPSSVRISAVDEIKAKLLARSSHRSVALGVEAGSERLRANIGKKISNEEIEKAIELLAREGVSGIRLYFMLGLPDENESDVEAIGAIAKIAKDVLSKYSPKGSGLQEVEVTLSAFVPKPLTKFCDEKFCGGAYFKKAVAKVKSVLAGKKGIKVSHDSAIAASAEAFIAGSKKGCCDFFEMTEKEGLRKALRSFSG